MANCHLAILKRPYLDAILAGEKIVESRFTRTKKAPFGQIQSGDKIFLKESCGLVCATAVAAKVKQFQNLTPKKILAIKQRYNHLIAGSEKYWQSKADCKYGILVWLKDIEPIEPMRINKKDWRAWVVLDARYSKLMNGNRLLVIGIDKNA